MLCVCLAGPANIIHVLCGTESCFDDLWQQTVETAKQCTVEVEAIEKRHKEEAPHLVSRIC